MQFKAVEVIRQICSLAWRTPTQTHTWSCLSGCQRVLSGLSYVHNMTKGKSQEKDRTGDKRAGETSRQMKGKGVEIKEETSSKTVIRRRKCLNRKWGDVTLTAQQPDRHMMELSSLILCHCPVRQRGRDLFSHFRSNFPGIGGHEISETWRKLPKLFLSFCRSSARNTEKMNFSFLLTEFSSAVPPNELWYLRFHS